MLAAFGPDQFAVGRMPITGIALGVGERINGGLQGIDAAVWAHLLPNNQPGLAVDGDDDADFVLFCLI